MYCIQGRRKEIICEHLTCVHLCLGNPEIYSIEIYQFSVKTFLAKLQLCSREVFFYLAVKTVKIDITEKNIKVHIRCKKKHSSFTVNVAR